MDNFGGAFGSKRHLPGRFATVGVVDSANVPQVFLLQKHRIFRLGLKVAAALTPLIATP